MRWPQFLRGNLRVVISVLRSVSPLRKCFTTYFNPEHPILLLTSAGLYSLLLDSIHCCSTHVAEGLFAGVPAGRGEAVCGQFEQDFYGGHALPGVRALWHCRGTRSGVHSLLLLVSRLWQLTHLTRLYTVSFPKKTCCVFFAFSTGTVASFGSHSQWRPQEKRSVDCARGKWPDCGRQGMYVDVKIPYPQGY